MLFVFVLAVAVWGFIELADEVLDGETLALDRSILLFLRDPSDSTDPVGPLWFEELARDVTALGSMALLAGLTLVAAGFLWIIHRARTAWFLVVTTLAGALVSALLKIGFDRPRPDLVPHATETFSKSFPSGHSAMSALVFLTLGALLCSVQSSRLIRAYIIFVACTATLAVGLSRVYLGVHWPTDVVAGWAFGIGWAIASSLTLEALQRTRITRGAARKTVDPAGKAGARAGGRED